MGGLILHKFRHSSKNIHHCSKIEPVYTLTSLYIYPVKSLAGIALESALVQPRGLQYDRRWMLVDETGRFISQREIPGLALLGTAIEPPYLVVFSRKNPGQRVEVPLEAPSAGWQKAAVQIWDDWCEALEAPAPVNRWFTEMLGRSVHLVFMPDSTRRPTDPRYAPADLPVSFADGFPFLLIGQASLDDLNRRLEQPLPMNRFRPNFVFAGGKPFEEDEWGDFCIGQAHFRGVKPCARCTIPTTDQDTAQRAAEPLKTLATFRQKNHKILFGQNVISTELRTTLMVSVGDRIEIQR